MIIFILIYVFDSQFFRIFCLDVTNSRNYTLRLSIFLPFSSVFFVSHLVFERNRGMLEEGTFRKKRLREIRRR